MKDWADMRILIDTNIVLDVLLKRQPFYDKSAKVSKLSAREDVEEFVSASAITDIYYIANRHITDKVKVRELIQNLLNVVSIAVVSKHEINKAFELEWEDFEDSVQYAVALLGQMEGLVTRNISDYSRSEISIWTPEQILEEIENL